jgi:hypothetical protein
VDTGLLLLFIAFISLVIADYFLTNEGVIKRGYPERTPFRKEIMTKYGNEKGNVLSSLISAGIGIFILIFFSTMEYFISELHLAGIIVFMILTGLLLAVVIINAVQLLKG